MATFRAFRISDESGELRGRVVDATVDELTPGAVLIKAAYSSVNYKDALAATGSGRILRRTPLIGGIDVSGTVASSTDPRFAAGQQVLVTGYDLGVAHDGGFSGYVRVPAEWVVALPGGLSLRDAMIYGTAGFTAALAIMRLERLGLEKGQGPLAVSGATGGVGSIATAALARLGYDVTAITGKADAHDYLRTLGARAVVDRLSLDVSQGSGGKPLEKATWAAAVDAVGGDLLSWLVRTTSYGGGVASTGLTGGIDLRLTVMPFLLRGVSLLGIDSVMCPMDRRLDAWHRLATDMKPANLDAIAHEVTLDELPEACATLMAGGARGRFLVRLET